MTTINCKSVLGGWQTQTIESGYLFGPIFNKTTDLWAWQENHISRGARCNAWGSDKQARRISGMSSSERGMVRNGELLFMLDCPNVMGCTVRKIIANNGRFYARLPIASDSGQVIL